MIWLSRIAVRFSAFSNRAGGPLPCVQVHGGHATRHRPQVSGRTIVMSSTTKRRLARGIGAGLAAAAALGTLGVTAASASTTPEGITVPGSTTAAPATLIASLEGRNEVTVGSPTGQALELIGISGNTLSYSISWRGLGLPTGAAIHAAGLGQDGPVVVPLFTTPPPADGFTSGTVTVTDPAVLAALQANPGAFYADLTTDKFPAGAVRAQLHQLTHAVSTSGTAAVQESVIHGAQIYACTATGSGTIAELTLDATQEGTPAGLLSNVVEVLRLNTHGGVQPAGTCDPQATPTVAVPYAADYIFING